jgi:hypothetical protein
MQRNSCLSCQQDKPADAPAIDFFRQGTITRTITKLTGNPRHLPDYEKTKDRIKRSFVN